MDGALALTGLHTSGQSPLVAHYSRAVQRSASRLHAQGRGLEVGAQAHTLTTKLFPSTSVTQGPHETISLQLHPILPFHGSLLINRLLLSTY